MKRKLLTIVLVVMLSLGMLACGSENPAAAESAEIEETPVAVEESVDGNGPVSNEEGEVEQESVIEETDTIEVSDGISDTAEPELMYEYEVMAMGTDAWLEFNVPNGFYYNENCSHIMSVVLEQADSEKITIEFANSQYMDMLETYMNSGTWNGIYDEQIEAVSDIDTLYGPAKLLSGHRNENKAIEHCYLDYEGCSWHIERIKGENAKPLEDVLNEMFTGKEEISQAENMHYKIDKINRTLLDDEYEYYLSENRYVSGENRYEVQNILGFNHIEGYDLHGTRTGSVDGVESYQGYEFTNYDGNNLTLYYTEYGIAHLKEVLTTGNGIYNLKLNDNNTLVSVEHKETLETPYGQAHILYQVKKSGEYNAENEFVILYVNDFEIIITFDYYSSDYSVLGYQGELAHIIPNMFAE